MVWKSQGNLLRCASTFWSQAASGPILSLPLLPLLDQVLPEAAPEMRIHGQVIYQGSVSGRNWEGSEGARTGKARIPAGERGQAEGQPQPHPAGSPRAEVAAQSFSRLEASAGVSCIAAAAKPLQSCPTLCDRRHGSPPGSPVPGILQARTLEWVAISFSKA